MALCLLERLLAFDPKCRLTAAEALADPYLNDMAKQELEPSIQPISKLEFEFERRKLSKDDVRELIYAESIIPRCVKVVYVVEIIQLPSCIQGRDFASGVDRFMLQFANLEEHHGKGERRSHFKGRTFLYLGSGLVLPSRTTLRITSIP
ncbi:mitogen-activated protein kinase 9 isoform X3 [Cucumis melo var. makuwa]|uniref:Mitogen-activated protein kinase 9 isoform X3 n=1 Tax=Cucumis melo var. makuwa TaxID=1194695 RepID=A0A5D3E4N0_CUCMM|nr:mitogen-activated protein kinase 9 isoform X3 [Cucumis melo var. makuwa]